MIWNNSVGSAGYILHNQPILQLTIFVDNSHTKKLYICKTICKNNSPMAHTHTQTIE